MSDTILIYFFSLLTLGKLKKLLAGVLKKILCLIRSVLLKLVS